MRARRGLSTTTAAAVALLLTATASAGAATLGGTFEVNNTLPRDAALTVTVTAEGATEAPAVTAVEAAGGAIA